MGIGRRDFLKLAGMVFAGLAIDPLSAVATNDNYYVNKKFGIMFEKPSDWGWVHVKDLGKIKAKQVLNGHYEAIKDEVWEDLGDPICIATKYFEDLPKYIGVFSPTITLQITSKQELLHDLEFDEDASIEEVIRLADIGTAEFFERLHSIEKI